MWPWSLINCSLPLLSCPSTPAFTLSCCILNTDMWAWPTLTNFQHPLIKGWLLKHRRPNASRRNLRSAEEQNTSWQGRRERERGGRGERRTDKRLYNLSGTPKRWWKTFANVQRSDPGHERNHGYYYPWCTAIWSHSRPLQLCSCETEWIWEQLLD